MILPSWAKKPKHKKEVVATQKGWVVKETGEVLTSHKNLDEKLDKLFGEVKELVSDMQEPKPEEEPKQEVVEPETEEKPKPTSTRKRTYNKKKTTTKTTDQ